MTTLVHRSRRRRLLLALLSFLVLALLLVGGVAYYAYSLTRPVTAAAGGKAYRLEVKPGRTLASVAREMEEGRVVRSADALRTIMRF
ncbi:MAG: endolytic transglycosylase MltG, partial [Deinococcus sp.]